MNQLLVSVVCLCHNHDTFICRALDSVKKQTYSNLELIVIDDFSTDNSRVEIEKWIDLHPNFNVRFIANLKKMGCIASFNYAASIAKGNYILDLFGSDILLPHAITKQTEVFKKTIYRNLGIVYGNVDLINEDNNFVGTYYDETDRPKSGDIYKMVIGKSTKICPVGVLIKREVFEKIGFYDESIEFEELDLWVRSSRLFDFEFLTTPIAQKRIHIGDDYTAFDEINHTRKKSKHPSSIKVLHRILQLNVTKFENRAVLSRMWSELVFFVTVKKWKQVQKLSVLMVKTIYRSF